jgi:nucleoside-diphosphate kinase
VPERTFFMLKPDGTSRGLEKEIYARIEQAGLKVIQKQRLKMSENQAADLYSPHLGKKFYPGLIRFITSGEVVCSVVEGEEAIARMRDLMGATDPREAGPGTIRGDLKEENVLNAEGIIKNLVHGSDSPESANREIRIFFK